MNSEHLKERSRRGREEKRERNGEENGETEDREKELI